MIFPPSPIKDITQESFLSEAYIFNLIVPYFTTINFTQEKINDWMGKDGNWVYTKRKMINGERKSGRSLNVVLEKYRSVF
jgi:hypothetical protein